VFSASQRFGFERTETIAANSAAAIANAAVSFGQEDDVTVLTLARKAEGLVAGTPVADIQSIGMSPDPMVLN